MSTHNGKSGGALADAAENFGPAGETPSSDSKRDAKGRFTAGNKGGQ